MGNEPTKGVISRVVVESWDGRGVESGVLLIVGGLLKGVTEL